MFDFRPQWKEELVVTCKSGEFVLEFPMGIPTVYLPSETVLVGVAPEWASGLWSVLKCELESWCNKNKVELAVDDSARIYLL